MALHIAPRTGISTRLWINQAANTETALIVGVGASRGLGAASAWRFAREGLHVVVAGRTAEKVERVAEEMVHVAHQDRSAWSFDVEIRPFGEAW